MDSAEFSGWLNDLKIKFPGIVRWFAGLENAKATSTQWRSVLEGVPRDVANEWSLSALKGDEGDDRFRDGWYETIPGRLRAFAMARTVRTNPVLDAPEPRRRHSAALVGSSRAFMEQIEKLMETDGITAKEAAARVLPEAADDPHRMPRYSCWQCQDSGWVWCWNYRAIRAAIAGEPVGTAGTAATFSAPCACGKGQVKRGDKFDREKLCRVESGDPDELRVWIHERQQAKRTSEFDQFNQRQRTPYAN